MSSGNRLISLRDLKENGELLLTKNTVKNNIDLENKVKNLINKIADGVTKTNNAEMDIGLLRSSEEDYQTKAKKRTVSQNKISKILTDLNDEYEVLFNEYTEIKSTPFYKKAYNGLKKQFNRDSTINESASIKESAS